MTSLREALVQAAVDLERRGLNHNSAGNLSVRDGDGLLVTPSGIPARDLRPDDMVHLDGDGQPDPGGRVPTSEWRLHLAVLVARSDVAAVVHTHSPEATALACVGRPLPGIHYVVARTGGPVVPCAPYATYGSAELADAVVATLGAGRACLMAHHGVLAASRTLAEAVALAHDVEWLAGVYRRALALGEPTVLPDDELARVAEQFGSYGQPEGLRPGP